MKKSTNKSTKGIMPTARLQKIGLFNWGFAGAGDETGTREYWLPKPVFAGSNPVTRSIEQAGQPAYASWPF